MKITPKNMRRKKLELATLACRIAHARDNGCRFPGCNRTRNLQAAHLVPRGHSFDAATDPDNVKLLCVECHRRHDNHTDRLPTPKPYPARRVTLEDVQRRADELTELAKLYGVIL